MKTANKKDQMYQKIQDHGEALVKLFKLDIDPVKLCKQLRKLEAKATILTEDECNTGKDNQVELGKILGQVKKILFPKTFEADIKLYKAVFINGDPRGYALKISDRFMSEYRKENRFYTDMGGYGILAPDFNNYTN